MEVTQERGKPLTHRMNEEQLRRALAKKGVSLPKKVQKKAPRGDKNNREAVQPYIGEEHMAGENEDVTQVPRGGKTIYVDRTRPVTQILKEEGVKTGLQTVAAAAVTAFGVWLSKKLGPA